MAKRYTFDDFINPERESKGIKRRLEIIDRNGHGNRPICRKRDPIETHLLIQSILDTFREEERNGNLVRKGRKWIVR